MLTDVSAMTGCTKIRDVVNNDLERFSCNPECACKMSSNNVQEMHQTNSCDIKKLVMVTDKAIHPMQTQCSAAKHSCLTFEDRERIFHSCNTATLELSPQRGSLQTIAFSRRQLSTSYCNVSLKTDRRLNSSFCLPLISSIAFRAKMVAPTESTKQMNKNAAAAFS